MIKDWIENIKRHNKIKRGKFENPVIPEIIFNMLFYTQQFRFRETSDYYDIAVLAILDIFIAYQMQETPNLRIFQGIPKIFTMSVKNVLLLNFLAVVNLSIQVKKNWGNNNFYFIFAVAWAIFFSTYSSSVTFSCILTTIVMTFALNIWEDLAQKELPVKSPVEKLKPNVSSLENNVAVAQDLIYKLKQLKFNMICEKEKLCRNRRAYLIKGRSVSYSYWGGSNGLNVEIRD